MHRAHILLYTGQARSENTIATDRVKFKAKPLKGTINKVGFDEFLRKCA